MFKFIFGNFEEDNHADTFDTTCRTACASTHYHYDKKTAPENGGPEHIVGSGKTG